MSVTSFSFVQLLAAFGVATLVAGLLVHTRDWHLHLTGDQPDAGPQKIHAETTPRIGGLAVWPVCWPG